MRLPPLVDQIKADTARAIKHTSGAAALEFMIATPVVMFFIFLFLQSVMLLHIQTVVDYSAFAAARSAAVWIPADSGIPIDSEFSGGSPGALRIHHAAALACMTVSLPSKSTLEGSYTRWIFKSPVFLSNAQIQEIKKRIDLLVYADAATTTKLKILSRPGRRYVVAEVSFIAPLVVPLAGPMLGNRLPPLMLPYTFPLRKYLPFFGRLPPYGFRTMRSSYAMPIED